MSQQRGNPSLESELRSAIATYVEQIGILNDAIEGDPENNEEAISVRIQLQNALDEARGALRASQQQDEVAGRGSCMTASAAAGGMDLGEAESGDECESKPSELHEADHVVEHGPEAQSSGRQGRNNPRMHPNNKYYREEPDFSALAKQFPEIRPYITQGPDGRSHYLFTSWDATRQLTATLLKKDFNIKWWLPEGHLVPTLTNRANYIHWIHDLLLLSNPDGPDYVRGLDIGCGANFIYPLLGAGIYGWSMVGCDITDVALTYSNKHIKANPHLSALLNVRDSRTCSGEKKSPSKNNVSDDLQAFCEGLPCTASLGGEGDKERRPAVRRGLDGHPKVNGMLEEQSNLQAGSSYGTSDVHDVHDIEGEAGPTVGSVSPAVCDAGPGGTFAAECHDGDQIPRPEHPMIEMVHEAAAETSSIAAGRLLAQALPSMAIGEVRAAGSLKVPSEPSMEAPVDTVVAPRPSKFIRALSGYIQATSTCDEAIGSEQNGGILMSAFRGATERFTFCMCNPPFFSSISEADSNPNTACGGTEAEMIFPGGELAFILNMIEDSVRLGARIHWYSSMVGKKVTLKAIRKELHSRHVTAIRTTEFAQGKTSRWAIAWSFDVDPNLANQPLPRALNPFIAAAAQAKRHISFSVQGRDGRKVMKAMEAALGANGAVNIAMDLGTWTLTADLPSEDKSDTFNGAQKRQRQPSIGAAGKDEGPVISTRINLFQQQRGRFDVITSVAKSATQTEALIFTMLMQKMQDDMNVILS